MVVLSSVAPLELGFEARGVAIGDAIDDRFEFVIAKRRGAPRGIPCVQQAERKRVITVMAEQMANNPSRSHVAIFGDWLTGELRPDVGRDWLRRVVRSKRCA